mmetsp:Transcript_20314/g.29921  ORF Transcript_20314/g.29921 Transcript_20314/m.29921 type:complete len:135 (-) Transcript_20314:362-766(-)
MIKLPIKSVGKKLQKLNLFRLIGELEQINEERIEECDRRSMVEEAVVACKKAIKEHLQDFMIENPDSSYEEWIRELHPDNAEYVDSQVIDHRLYAPESDHRQMWNEYVEQIVKKFSEKRVEAKHVLPNYDRKAP